MLLSPIEVELEIVKLERLAKKWKRKNIIIKPSEMRSGGCDNRTKKGCGGLDYLDGNFQ